MSWNQRREPDRRTALSTTVLGRLGISATPTSNQSRPKFKASRKEQRKQQRQTEKQQRQQRIMNKHQSKKNDSPAAKTNQPVKAQRVVVKTQPQSKQPDSESEMQSDEEPVFESDGDDDIDHELLKVSKKLGIDKNPAALQKGGSVYNEFALDGLDVLNDLFLEYDARKKKYSADDYKKQLGGSKDSTSTKEKKVKEKEATQSSVGRNLYGQPTAAIPNPDLSNQSNKRKSDELSDDDEEDQDSFDEENSEFEDDGVDQDDSEQDEDAFGLNDFDMSQLEAQSGDSDEQSDEDQEFDSELESNESDEEMDNDVDDEQSEESEEEQPKAATKAASASAYVPPHLRNKTDSQSTLSAEDQRQQMLLKRRVQGLYNKLTEGNIDSIATELRGIYAENARRLVNTVLCDSLIATCSTPSSLVPALLMAAAALITSLNNAIGVQVGAMFVEHVAHSLRDAIEQNESIRSSNLVLLMTHFYNFQLVDCVLIYSMIEHLCKRFSEVDIELLLILLKYCGTQLRKDDPAALKDIITTIQTRAKALIGTDEPSSATSAAAPTLSDVATLASKFQNKTKSAAPVAAKSAVSFRVQVMLDMIYDLKNNKKRQVDVTDALQSLQKWLSHLSFRTSQKSVDRQLRVTWNDLMDSEKKGRWWLVGSAWTGNGDTKANASSATTGIAKKSDIAEFGDISADLQALAKQMRMNTDIRRMIFVAVMGSVDFMDCFEKLHKLNLHGKQEREIVRVLLECCAQEGVYNPFYAHVALKLCTFESAFRFTFQLAYWDQFKLFSNMAPRRASNLAKLLGHLMCNKVETLAMLKVIEWQTLDSAAILFMHALFSHMMQNSTDEDLKSMFGKIAAKENLQSLVDGIGYFFQRHFLPTIKQSGATGQFDHANMQTRVKIAKKAMEQLVKM